MKIVLFTGTYTNNSYLYTYCFYNNQCLQEGHDGPGIAHLGVIALMPYYFLQLKLINLVEVEKRNILVKLIS